MNAFDALPRQAVRLNALSRHHWGADPGRTVRVVVLDTPEGQVGRVIGDDAGKAVVLEEGSIVEWNRQRLTLADGTRWEIRPPAGCSCKTPEALKRLDPRKV